MSSLASTKFAASQYALMTSLCALPGSLLAGASGFVIVNTGFEDFFIDTSLIGIPVALLAWFVWRNHPPLLPLSAVEKDVKPMLTWLQLTLGGSLTAHIEWLPAE